MLATIIQGFEFGVGFAIAFALVNGVLAILKVPSRLP
jgi:hypothetical protein